MNQETRNCQNCKREFLIEPEDFEFYKKIKVPPPTWCPTCRDQRRWIFRNERNLGWRKCDLCGKKIISVYSPDNPFPIYCHDCWYSDKWDVLDFGMEFDSSRPFLQQVRELQNRVPKLALVEKNNVNSHWMNYEEDSKNCYLCVGGEKNEDCLFTTYGISSKNIVQGNLATECEIGYDLLNCTKCYRTFFSHWCFECRDVWFSYDCKNCVNCFGCVNLRNKRYHIFNQPYSKEEYEKIIQEEYFSLTREKIKSIIRQKEGLRIRLPTRDFVVKSINCTGNYVIESKNSRYNWNVIKMEESKYINTGIFGKDCMDASSIGWMENVYECYSGVRMYNCYFSVVTFECTNIVYGDNCFNSQDCLGCAGVRNKQYCILNKQYSKQEYSEKKNIILEQMNSLPYKDARGKIYKFGEFFPPEFSPFAYNGSTSQQYYPLTKEEAEEFGFSWKDSKKKDFNITVKGEELPEKIEDTGDDVLKAIIECSHKGECNEQCNYAYIIIPQELYFHRKEGIPLPQFCPNCRHHQQFRLRNPLKLWKRNCAKCAKGIETSFAPERPEIVYCEECYNKEVV